MKLPRYQRQVGALPVEAGPRAPVGAPASLGVGLEKLGQTGMQFAGQLMELRGRIEAEKAKVALEADVAARMAQAEMQIVDRLGKIRQTVKDPIQYRRHALNAISGVIETGSIGVEDDTTRAVLSKHLSALAVKYTLQAQKEEDALFVDHVKGQTESTLDAIRKVAGSLPLDRPDEYMVKIQEGMQVAAGATAVMGNDAATARVIKFRDDVLADRAFRHAEADPQGFMREAREGATYSLMNPEERVKHLERARKTLENREARADANFKKAKELVVNDWYSRSQQGQLADWEIRQALENRNPYITPKEATQFSTVNDAPFLPGSDLQVQVIMQEYHGALSTVERIATYRARLNDLARDLGWPTKMLGEALDELQTDERTMLGIEAQQISAGMKWAEDKYIAEGEPLPPGRLGQIERNLQQADRAEMRARIRRGEKPDTVVEEILKRRERDRKAVPDKTKRILDLLE